MDVALTAFNDLDLEAVINVQWSEKAKTTALIRKGADSYAIAVFDEDANTFEAVVLVDAKLRMEIGDDAKDGELALKINDDIAFSVSAGVDAENFVSEVFRLRDEKALSDDGDGDCAWTRRLLRPPSKSN